MAIKTPYTSITPAQIGAADTDHDADHATGGADALTAAQITASPNPHGQSNHSTATRTLMYPIGLFTKDVIGTTSQETDSQGRYAYLGFPEATSNYRSGNFNVPDDWVSGVLTFFAWFMMDTANVGEVVRLNLFANVFSHGTDAIAIGQDSNEDFTVTDAIETTQRVQFAGTITPSAAGQMLKIRFGRVGAHVNDNAEGILKLSAIEISYTGKP